MADPTNARMRTLNSFFDSPRFAIKALPTVPDEVASPAAAPATPVAPAAKGPALTLSLAPKRTQKGFLADGLLVKVTADRAVTDVEARLFEVLPAGALRPLGSAFRTEPGPQGATLRIEPTRFARSRLKRGKGRRSVVLKVTATGRDGVTSSASSSFHLR